jgi:hypothetical protein
MKSIAYLTLAMVLALGIGGAAAQGTAAKTESFVGVVKAVSGTSVTVERGSIVGTFTVDANTHIAARGATAKTKEAKEAGKPGLTVPDAVHVGDQVVVKFREMKGAMMASEISVRTASVQPAKK